MRYKDPKKMQEIVNAIEYYKLKEGIEPTLDQISADTGISRTRVHAYLQEMNEKGIVSYGKRHMNTPKTEMISDDINTAAIVGSVKCGDPTLEEADVLEYVRLPASIFGNKESYILRARGDSMVDAGIDDGDYIVVENRQNAQKEEIVVALDEEGANTLKRLKGINKKTKKVILAYENQAVYPDKTLEMDQMRIQGVAKFVIKKL